MAAVLVCWCGDPARGAQVLAPLRAFGPPAVDGIGEMPYVALQSMLDGGAPHGRHYYWKAHRLPTLGDGVVDALLAAHDALPTPFSQINGWAVGGAVSRADPAATAVGERETGFELSCAAGWAPGDAAADAHVAWVRRGWETLQPYSTGLYANFISDEGAAGARAAYGDRLTRLTALKDRMDPGNVFHLNANIQPTAGTR
jgi:hypothetical protein